MQINHLPGLIAVILAVICFYGTTYLVIALNLGWRFGYWVTGAVFGALMVLLSIFWIINPVGPRGEEARWVAIAAGKQVSQVSFKDKALTTPGQYPGGSWRAAQKDDEQADAFSSALTTCISTKPEKLPEEEKEPCLQAQSLMPQTEDIPVLLGSAVAVLPQVTDIRFAEEGGNLAQGTVRPITLDPRVTKDPKGKLLAPPFRIVAILDKGSLRLPPLASVGLFLVFFLFHLRGLDRAEKRKLNPAVI
jgi:hypothetical protein